MSHVAPCFVQTIASTAAIACSRPVRPRHLGTWQTARLDQVAPFVKHLEMLFAQLAAPCPLVLLTDYFPEKVR